MKKILMIEDDAVIAAIYRAKLTQEGYEVEIAEHGIKGLEMIERAAPDVVVLDLSLPRINGVEVIRQIRANDNYKVLPILVLSNFYHANLVQEAWKAGANRCLSKAECSPQLLTTVVEKILSGGAALPKFPPSSAPLPGLFSAPDEAPDAAPPQAAPAPEAPPPAPEAPPPAEAPAPPEVPPRLIIPAFSHAAPSFVAEGQTIINAVRKSLPELARAEGPEARQVELNQIYYRCRWLTSRAALENCPRLAQMLSAFEAFVRELFDKPSSLNPSTMRTLVQTVDFIDLLLARAGQVEAVNVAPPMIVVVDDEALSRRAVTYALERAGLRSLPFEDAATALSHLSAQACDLIMLDVDMPGMNGFELCQKIRELPHHALTPVVFVTAMTDFESREKSTLCGGNDLIAKPFLFMELAVKALTFILKARIGNENV